MIPQIKTAISKTSPAFTLTLPLLVTFIRANDANDAAALHDFAVLTQFFY